MKRRVLPAFALLAALTGSGCRDEDPGPRGVLVVCVDTLRADRVGCLGSGRETSPEIDRLAARGTSFRRAFVPAPFTAPSVTTMMTGASPLAHGVRSWQSFGRRWRAPTLARMLRAHDWRTALLGANGFLHAIRPVRDGFERFEDIHDRPGPALTRRALEWIDEVRRGPDPWFLWVHYFDPHAPYRHHEEHGERFAPRDLRERWEAADPETLRTADPARPGWDEIARLFTGLYEGEVAFADDAVGALLRGLEERGLRDRTLVILTADHGENLADHSPHFTHRNALFDSLIRVPLIVAGPGVIEGETVHGLVALEDLPRTVLEHSGVETPEGIGGRSLGPALRGEPFEPAKAVFADAGLQDVRLLAVRTVTRKLLRRGEGEAVRLEGYRLDEDPGEETPFLALPDDALADRLDSWIARETDRFEDWNGPDDGRPDTWSPEELRQLRAFGYLR